MLLPFLLFSTATHSLCVCVYLCIYTFNLLLLILVLLIDDVSHLSLVHNEIFKLLFFSFLWCCSGAVSCSRRHRRRLVVACYFFSSLTRCLFSRVFGVCAAVIFHKSFRGFNCCFIIHTRTDSLTHAHSPRSAHTHQQQRRQIFNFAPDLQSMKKRGKIFWRARKPFSAGQKTCW